MELDHLPQLADQLLAKARDANSGRASQSLRSGRDVQLRGLAALDTRWMLGLPDVTFRPPYRRPLGVRVDGIWYYAWPLRWDGTPGVGAQTVVSLSN